MATWFVVKGSYSSMKIHNTLFLLSFLKKLNIINHLSSYEGLGNSVVNINVGFKSDSVD